MQAPCEWVAPGEYVVSTDSTRLDVDQIHRFLSEAYWSPGIPRAVVDRAIKNSLAFGLYASSGRQAGFARAVTDRATFAYLADAHRLYGRFGFGPAPDPAIHMFIERAPADLWPVPPPDDHV